jgi:hypothetical protein
MLDGVTLTLLIGPGVPVLAPSQVLHALESVQVTSGTDRAGFQLVFRTGTTSPLVTTMLPAGYFDPIVTRVIVIATVRGLPHVLIDGVVTRQEVSPSSDPGKSMLSVTGEDLTVLMDLVEMPFMRYPAMPEVAQLYTILAKYAVFGIAPIVLPPIIPAVRTPMEGMDTHTGTDLEYIRQHARRCGYTFYIEPGPVPATSIAYFGPDVRIPIPQRPLNVNLDAHTNVESLSLSLDGTAKKIVVFTIFEPATQKVPIPVPVPNVSVLRPPLGARPTPPARVEFAEGSARLTPAEAAKQILGMTFAASDAITGSGSLDVVRYGRPLRSRMLVGVRGAGLAYDGLYYVNSVTHDLKRGSYKQNFSLSRDGLISPTPVVPTAGPEDLVA